MRKSELLSAILSDYKASETPTEEDKVSAEKFCAYAETWMGDNGVVGVGYAMNGLSIKLADHRELAIYGVESVDKPDNQMLPVGITGNVAAPARPGVMPTVDVSHAITGR